MIGKFLFFTLITKFLDFLKASHFLNLLISSLFLVLAFLFIQILLTIFNNFLTAPKFLFILNIISLKKYILLKKIKNKKSFFLPFERTILFYCFFNSIFSFYIESNFS
jgi:hypothetical protein